MEVWRYISRMLPESTVKDRMRVIFYKWISRKWPVPIKSVKLLSDEGVLLELENSIKFISEVYPKWGVCALLHAQLVDRVYTKHYRLKKGDIVVDAGANIGVFTVLAAKSVGGDGKVIAIEPEKKNLENLKKNIEINGLNNVVIVPKGLWDRKGRKRIYLSQYSERHSLVILQEAIGKTEETEVDTLDNILKELGVSKVDFIKMDIEGAEIRALDGKTLETSCANLAIAAYHMVSGSPTWKLLVPRLEKAGFDVREENGFVYARKTASTNI